MDQSHPYKQDVPHDFSKCMKANLFLSSHPKFSLKISFGSLTRPPSKNPISIMTADDGYESSDANEESSPS
jgi:hypothetical protein